MAVIENPDVISENHGTIIGLTISTPAAQAWVEEHLELESWQWLGNTINIEPRCAQAIIEGMQDDGLTVA